MLYFIFVLNLPSFRQVRKSLFQESLLDYRFLSANLPYDILGNGDDFVNDLDSKRINYKKKINKPNNHFKTCATH